MTLKSGPEDRKILRDSSHALRPDRRDWSTATMVAPRKVFLGYRHGKVSFCHDLAPVLGGTSGGQQPKQFVRF